MNVLCVGITKWCYNIRKWGHVTQKFYSSPTVFFLPKSVISQGRIINKSIKVTVVHPGCHLVPTTAHRSSSFNIKVYVISLLGARKKFCIFLPCYFPSQYVYHYEVFFFTHHNHNHNVYSKKFPRQ